MRTHASVLIAIVAFTLNASAELRLTPRTDLESSRRLCESASNLVARGMFREADSALETARRMADERIRELESLKAVEGPLRAFATELQSIRERFKEDWANTGPAAIDFGNRIRGFVDSNEVVRAELDWPMRSFNWLLEELRAGSWRDADVTLRNVQGAIRRQLEVFEESQSCEDGFRSVLANAARMREALAVERSKPLDTARALAIARECLAEMKEIVEGPDRSFVGADRPFATAMSYLNDIRVAGQWSKEAESLANSLEQARRASELRGFRQSMNAARIALRRYRFDLARQNIQVAESIHLAEMEKRGSFPGLVAGLRTEAEELLRAVALSEDVGILATGDAEIARSRSVRGGSSESRAGAESLKEELEGTDLAANLKAGLDRPIVRINVFREWEEWPVEIPREHWTEVSNAVLGAVEAAFPERLVPGERYHLEFVVSDEPPFSIVDADKQGRREVFREEPSVLFLDVVVLSSDPSDVYLDYPGPGHELFVPGGKTLKFPGLGALLKRILPEPVPAC